MLIKAIEKISELCSKNKDLKKYYGIYQWRSHERAWLFDIYVDKKCSCNIINPEKFPTYELFIDENDLKLLVNKELSPQEALNSEKLRVACSTKSQEYQNRNHIEEFLNTIFNRAIVNTKLKEDLQKLSPTADEVLICPIVESSEELKNFINLGSPCILKSSECKKWKIFKMSEEDVISMVGKDFEITLLTAEHDPEQHIKADYITSTLAEYINQLHEFPHKENLNYMAANSVPKALSKCFSYPPYFDQKAFNNPRWWIGHKNTGLGLHRDLVDNFLYQIKGMKKVYLFSPSESCYLYPIEFGGNPFYEPSLVNVMSPNLEKYPKYRKAKGIQCELMPGDMLYLPAGWWHCMQNLSVSWSINFFAVNQSPTVLNKIKED